MDRGSLAFQLGHGEVLNLRRRRGWTLSCRRGAVMVSGPRPLGDVELASGQALILPGNGVILVEAWGKAELALEAPARQPARNGCFSWLAWRGGKLFGRTLPGTAPGP